MLTVILYTLVGFYCLLILCTFCAIYLNTDVTNKKFDIGYAAYWSLIWPVFMWRNDI